LAQFAFKGGGAGGMLLETAI